MENFPNYDYPYKPACAGYHDCGCSPYVYTPPVIPTYSYETDWLANKVKVKKLHKDAIIPTKAYEGDACFDLYSLIDIEITGGNREIVPTGIAIELPDGYEAQIRPRSSTFKRGFHVQFGTVDSGYRGDVGILITPFNTPRHSMPRVKIKKGQRIAQMKIAWTPTFELEEVDELTKTDRDEKGFGSSGV